MGAGEVSILNEKEAALVTLWTEHKGSNRFLQERAKGIVTIVAEMVGQLPFEPEEKTELYPYILDAFTVGFSLGYKERVRYGN